MFSWTHCKPSTWEGKVFTSCIHCLSRQTLSPNKFDYNKEMLHRGTSRKVSCKSNQEHGVFLPSGCDLIWEQTNPTLTPTELLVPLLSYVQIGALFLFVGSDPTRADHEEPLARPEKLKPELPELQGVRHAKHYSLYLTNLSFTE